MAGRFQSPPLSSRYRNMVHEDMNHSYSPTHGEDGGVTLSSYQDYPVSKPFINSEYRRDTSKPSTAYPETHRPAVMAALRNLQDRIRQLELERAEAEENMKDLSMRASSCKESLTGSSPPRYRHPSPPHDRTPQGRPRVTTRLDDDDERHDSPDYSILGQDKNEIRDQLSSAENRCNLLEKQLEYMRQLFTAAEKDRTDAVRRAAELQQYRDNMEADEIKSQLDKINALERDHLRLTATQTLAEGKIRELEEKLREERHHRKLMQGRAAEMETLAETNRILQSANNAEAKKAKKVKKKKVVSSRGKMPQLQAKRQPTTPTGVKTAEHYRLNLAEIPFVAGTSTTPSHSLPANVQNVLSMMKHHNDKLCGGSLHKDIGSHAKSKLTYTSSGYYSTGAMTSSGSNSNSGGGSTRTKEESELADLLLQLQDEFGQLSFEHQEIMQQIHETTDTRIREDLERELDVLIARMEAKGDQIAKLRRHKEKVEDKKRKKKKTVTKVTRQRPQTSSASMTTGDEVEVTTTIRSKGAHAQVMSQMSKNRPHSATGGGNSLGLLKDLKKIQTSLRKDDLSWDC